MISLEMWAGEKGKNFIFNIQTPSGGVYSLVGKAVKWCFPNGVSFQCGISGDGSTGVATYATTGVSVFASPGTFTTRLQIYEPPTGETTKLLYNNEEIELKVKKPIQ